MTIEVNFKNDWATGQGQNDFTVIPNESKNFFRDPKEKGRGLFIHCNKEDDGGRVSLWHPFLLSEGTELQGALGFSGTSWIKNNGSIRAFVNDVVVAEIRHISR